MYSKKIAVIGAGSSGLAGIKTCLDEGLDPVCFERASDIGGLWNYTEDTNVDHGGVYRSCTINTSKEMMSYSDFPMPDEYPNFMPHYLLLKYLHSYANHFNLKERIRFRHSVQWITPNNDYEDTGRFKVTVTDLSTNTTSTIVFDGVLICSGHHCHPKKPHFQGLDSFEGRILHSYEYRRPEAFDMKKVLVVGCGNSAVDIAVDTGRTSQHTYLSTRRGAWIVSRMGPYGLPADALANTRFMFSFPNNWLQWIVERMSNFRFNHNIYGLGAEHRALEMHPTINDELPYEIMKGRVIVKPNIEYFGSNFVVFSDGTRAEIDVVVFATGYHYKYDFVDEDVMRVEKNDVDLYRYTFPPSLRHGSLALVGLVQPIGATIPISEMQSRWFASIMAGSVSLPSNEVMHQQILKKKEWIRKQFVKSSRSTILTFWIEFMDGIGSEIGCKPDLMKLFWKEPLLALRCFFGPCVPAQYRLQGPGQSEKARTTIKHTISRMTAPTQTRPIPGRKNGGGSELSQTFWICLLLLGMIYFLIFHIPIPIIGYTLV